MPAPTGLAPTRRSRRRYRVRQRVIGGPTPPPGPEPRPQAPTRAPSSQAQAPPVTMMSRSPITGPVADPAAGMLAQASLQQQMLAAQRLQSQQVQAMQQMGQQFQAQQMAMMQQMGQSIKTGGKKAGKKAGKGGGGGGGGKSGLIARMLKKGTLQRAGQAHVGGAQLMTWRGVTMGRPAMRTFIKAVRKYGKGLPPVVSDYRSRAEQASLYSRYLAGTGNLAARPGTSDHERGWSLDISTAWLRANPGFTKILSNMGWKNNVAGEPWHWTFKKGL